MRTFTLLLCAVAVFAAYSTSAHATLTAESLYAQGYVDKASLFRDKKVYFHPETEHTVVVDEPVDPKPKYMDELFDSMMPHHKTRMEKVQKRASVSLENNPYFPDTYWSWVPIYVGSVFPGQNLTFEAGCFLSTTLSIDMLVSTGIANITFTTAKPKTSFCTDFYLITTVTTYYNHNVEKAGNSKVEWHGFSAVEIDDIARNGFRVFRFLEDESETILDVYETALLFLGALDGKAGAAVPDATAEHNLRFLKDYANLNLVPRNVTDVPFDESEIQSGDWVGVLRLDGLDPMICWGSASALGHTTVAIRNNGTLYICESQTKSNYWPVNLIQCNPFTQWIQWAKAADYNVVVLPLSPEKRAQFNETAAWEFAQTQLGNLYGYHNFLFGWIDTPDQNLPAPVDQHLTMTLFAVLDPILEPVLKLAHVPSLWNEALNQRLGTFYKRTAEIYQEAATRNVTFGQLISMVEQDSWIYPGDEPYYPPSHSMVCDVFVCNVLRAGGLFGDLADQINCAEFAPLDVYELNWYNSAPPPQKCLDADPGNKFCQILGKYRVVLPEYNTVQPFAHMREHCPSMPPYTDRYNPIAKTTC